MSEVTLGENRSALPTVAVSEVRTPSGSAQRRMSGTPPFCRRDHDPNPGVIRMSLCVETRVVGTFEQRLLLRLTKRSQLRGAAGIPFGTKRRGKGRKGKLIPSNGAELTIRECPNCQEPWRIRADDDQERHASRLQEWCAAVGHWVATFVSAARRHAAKCTAATKPPAS